MSLLSIYTKGIRYIKKEFNRNTLLFAVFFCIASLLWLINALNKTYTVDITLQAKYSHIPKTKAPITKAPEEIVVQVTASGFSLLQYYMYSSQQIDVNIEKRLQDDIDGDSTLVINIAKEITDAHLFSKSIQIQSVKPEFVTFIFAPVSKKKVKVVALYDIECLQQYQLSQTPVVIPDSIFVYGAQIVLESIDSVYTTKIYARQVAESFTRKISLQPITNVTYSDTVVTVKASIEKFTEQQFTIPITPIHVPDSIIIDLMQHSVTITVFTGMSKTPQVSANDFKVIADFMKQNALTGEIPVEVVARSPWGRIVKVSPEYVGYIIDTK
jgi:hypothetical protein